MIVGIDEVGRGAWAGPLCVGAVALGETNIEGLTDSKKLSKKKREQLTYELKRSDARLGVGWVSAKLIDKIGMSKSLKLASEIALRLVDGDDVEQIIIDGTIRLIDDSRVTTLKQADLLVPSVSAASIIAKVARDDYMVRVDQVFSGYGFERHVGYGTSIHTEALLDFGPSPIHRMTFAPMKETFSVPPSATKITTGQQAENAATNYLKSIGFEIVERNWKTKWCEIDIVAKNKRQLYFVEVKYRVRSNQGDGLAAITVIKQRQMRFAADFWLHVHKREDFDSAQLSALALTGPEFTVINWLEKI